MSDTEQDHASNGTAGASATGTSQPQPLNQKSMEIFATVLQCTSEDISKQVDFTAVASKLGYKNAEVAKKRFQQVRKQLADSTGTIVVRKRGPKSQKVKTEGGNKENENENDGEGGGLRGGDASGNAKRRGRKPKNAGADDGKENGAKGKRAAKRVKMEQEEEDVKVEDGEDVKVEDGDLEDGEEEVKENLVKCEE
ncbi:hypothetical protein TWF696_009513 [Orbilia brochopaga]|uniref:Uncharacterized protein n=1 Tax=Orbilia brochopaga TaxID=3140254 RepID=A0AAV9UBI5_9PEZI